MSAMGQKLMLEQASEMSGLPTKAEMRLAIQKCPLSARSGHAEFRGGPLLCPATKAIGAILKAPDCSGMDDRPDEGPGASDISASFLRLAGR